MGVGVEGVMRGRGKGKGRGEEIKGGLECGGEGNSVPLVTVVLRKEVLM